MVASKFRGWIHYAPKQCGCRSSLRHELVSRPEDRELGLRKRSRHSATESWCLRPSYRALTGGQLNDRI